MYTSEVYLTGFLFVRTETGQEDDYARYYDNVAPIEEFVNVQQQVLKSFNLPHLTCSDLFKS